MNKTFKWSQGVGLGLVLWATMLVMSMIFSWIGVVSSPIATVIMAVIAGILAFMFAYVLDETRFSRLLQYGLLWAAIGIISDMIVVHNLDYSVMNTWQYWLMFAAVLIAPAIHRFEAATLHSSDNVHLYQ